MKSSGLFGSITAGLAVCAVLCAGCATEQEEAATERAANVVDPAAKTAARAAGSGPVSFSGTDTLWNAAGLPGEAEASFGDEPVWTSTTIKAANRGTTGSRITVVGEVVDVSCYMQLGKRGKAHIPCGTDCVKNGAPIGVVDDKNELYIVLAEEHDPRRYGNIALREAMIPFMARTVKVTGMLTERAGVKSIYVLGYTTGDNPNQPKGE